MSSTTQLQTSPLRLENVTKHFGGVVAVENVSLEIPRGAFTTLLGPSGCGKTTLLRIIAGFYEPDNGHIFLDDKIIDAVPTHQRGTAMVFQDYALWPHMTVFALPDLMFFFKADLEVSLSRILDGRPQLKYFEAGLDLRLSSDPYESFRIFQGRILQQYLAMSSEFKFLIIDANQTIEAQQNVVRTLVAGKLDLPSFAWKTPVHQKSTTARPPQD